MLPRRSSATACIEDCASVPQISSHWFRRCSDSQVSVIGRHHVVNVSLIVGKSRAQVATKEILRFESLWLKHFKDTKGDVLKAPGRNCKHKRMSDSYSYS